MAALDMLDSDSLRQDSLKHNSLKHDFLKQMLNAVATGRLSPEEAFQNLKAPDSQGYAAVSDFAKVDSQRAERTGFPEVIWGKDKTADQIAQIMKAQRSSSGPPRAVMATRVEAETYRQIAAQIEGTQYFELARICAIAPPMHSRLPGNLAVLTAGTSDLPVAEEAAVTAELMGLGVTRLWDVGVAGIHRLLNNREVLEQADVLIVVAGMEGALPSVVGGLAQCPVIAVPTSIGYGASFGGLAALLGMLNSCSAGIGVVNIDNGFGAAILAGQILLTAARLQDDAGQRPR